jgi:diguanylate cyclase (GGDEF)-like protein/PAS domain S-box-containing protein
MNAVSSDVPVVLVVDDEAMTRALARETLEAEGLEVEEAASGAEGLALFRRRKVDLVLLDVLMPGMDGLECCRHLRADPRGARVPVVILTGMDDDASIERAYDAGATDFMPKPVPWKVLGHRVRYLLRASGSLEALARSQASLAYAQSLARVGNWEWRLDAGSQGGATFWSEEIYRILGLEPGAVAPSLEAALARVPQDERPQIAAAFAALLKAGTQAHNVEHRVVRADGSERIVLSNAEAIRDASGRAVLLRGTAQDITERKQIEGKIRALAYFDSLTGLPNRLQFKEQLARAVHRCGRGKDRIAVMFLDLDRFKQINDSLGHPVGDELLKAVAARLVHSVRGGDDVGRAADGQATARLGGDEFTVLLSGLACHEDAGKVAARIVAEIARPFSVAGQELFISASVGIAVYPADGTDVDTLLKNADVAMYSAKDSGRNNYKFYSSELNARALERLNLERDLHRALERNEFLLHYQPQIDRASGRVTGVEALLRWNHAQRGLVPPGHFIPIAEQTGLIAPIGEWVLERACRQAKAWSDEGVGELEMWVNVSGVQFRDRKLAGAIRRALELSGLEPRRLVIEATETIMLEDREATLAILTELKALGIRIAIDDFGTGYSSLAYLKRFPLDTLKIDGSFVRDLDTDAEDRAIVAAIIAMGSALKLNILAEGVETAQQAALLHEMGCPRMQGYYFARPVPAEDLAARVRANLGLAERNQLPALACG